MSFIDDIKALTEIAGQGLALLQDTHTLMQEVHQREVNIGNRLSRVEGQLAAIKETGETAMAAIDDLQAQVAQVKTVDDSAIALLQGLKAALDAAIASGDPARIQALSDELGAKTAELAAAVTANTPVAP